mmetsp:Transcript_56325/g.146417  ORF Transcript_56325/g.146417 Transcript_56325/m.146417 type:complete len:248 (+) Transcript_56325:441-1184(+)
MPPSEAPEALRASESEECSGLLASRRASFPAQSPGGEGQELRGRAPRHPVPLRMGSWAAARPWRGRALLRLGPQRRLGGHRLSVPHDVLWVDLRGVVDQELPEVRLAQDRVYERVLHQPLRPAVGSLHLLDVAQDDPAEQNDLAVGKLRARVPGGLLRVAVALLGRLREVGALAEVACAAGHLEVAPGDGPGGRLVGAVEQPDLVDGAVQGGRRGEAQQIGRLGLHVLDPRAPGAYLRPLLGISVPE